MYTSLHHETSTVGAILAVKKQAFLRSIALGSVIATLGSIVISGAEVMAETEPTWYNCLTREVFTPEKQIWCDRWQTLQNATYTVPTNLDSNPEFITVTLENGRYQRNDNQFIVELVNEANWMAFGDINEDGKEDAAVIFGVALDPDGRAVATYLTAVLDVDGAAQALTPIRLGERIMLNAPIAIGGGQITVPFLTQTEVIDRTYQIDAILIESRRSSCQ